MSFRQWPNADLATAHGVQAAVSSAHLQRTSGIDALRRPFGQAAEGGRHRLAAQQVSAGVGLQDRAEAVALETAHALHGAKRWAEKNPGKRAVICMSGRGDKDMPTLQRTLLAGNSGVAS